MNRALRILHLEDDPDYCDLVRGMLAREGFEFELIVADGRAAFEAALEKGDYDLILADYLLPGYTGMDALLTARREHPETPFLLISGTIGEQAAIEGLRAGATDYVLKLWPDRLVPAVRRALEESSERRNSREMEAELARREKHFRALTENSLDVVTILDARARFLYNSSSVRSVLGVGPAELQGKCAFDLIHPDDLPTLQAAFMKGLQHPESSVTLSFRIRRNDGAWRYLEAVGQSRLGDPDIRGVVVNSRDITEQKQLEEQLRQAQKMEAIGQLAGGVAHDFNNILMVINGYAALLASANLPESAAHSAREIQKAADRAARLTRQLLAFSRRQLMQLSCLDLNEIVGNLSRMLGRILGENIRLQINPAPRPAYVRADAGMIEQVLMNLAVNARDAMPGGGSLRIWIEFSPKSPWPSDPPEAGAAAEMVCLTVSDSGTGIAPEHLPRLFEPFFTTKEAGKGTGLGLATVYGIIKQHQGAIDVESEPGRGARFRVWLPAAAEPGAATERAPEPHALPQGCETILVVEDEQSVRHLFCSLLERHGYQILQADSAGQALEIWQNHKRDIDLLLADVVLPDRLNGRELAERLLAEAPRLKVILTSGYSTEMRRPLDGDIRFLQKPCQPRDLLKLVRETLGSGQDPAAPRV